MSENRNDEFEVTMSRKIQDKPQSSEGLSTGFRKMEKLGKKAPMTKVNIPNQNTETISTDKAKEQNREPVQDVKDPVLNIKKQIQINQQDVRMVTEENNHSEKKIESDENKAEETKKVKRNKKNGGSQKNKGKIIAGIVAVVVVIVAIILLWPCEHEWVDATCTVAKTCSKCDTTEGKPLGHSWSKATCTKPSECKLCKETEGKALGHKWKETEEYDYINSKIIKYSVCNTCKTKENKTTTKLNTILGKDKTRFYISPQDFAKRLDRILNDVETTKGFHAVWVDDVTTDDPGVEIRNRSGAVEAVILFQNYRNSTLESITAKDKQKEDFTAQMMLITLTYYKDMFEVLTGFVKGCDPEIENDDGVAASIVVESVGEALAYGDMVYSIDSTERGFIVWAMPRKQVEKSIS